MDIAAAVRSARRFVGASQREFARLLGVSPTTVANWESGCRLPSLSHLEQLLGLQGLELGAAARADDPSAELVQHLHLPLTVRLRLALGEHPNPYIRATSDPWRALLTLGRLGRVVVQPPVALGLWIPTEPAQRVTVVVHEPRGELPLLPGADLTSREEPGGPSLVPVTVEGPVRVWVLPPGELLADEGRLLAQAAALLAATENRDDAARRAPAHRDPNEWVEAARMLMTKGTEHLERPMPELGRAWRLGSAVSSAQAVRAETWRRSQQRGSRAAR